MSAARATGRARARRAKGRRARGTPTAKERLRETAAQLFFEKGYARTGVQELCDKAGLQRGSFYHFYASKSDLALDAIDHYDALYGLERWQRELVPEAEAFEMIRRLFESYYAFQRGFVEEGHPVRGCLLGNMALEMSHHDDAVRDRVASVLERWARVFEDAIVQAIDFGYLTWEVNPRTNAEAIMAYAEGVLLMAKAQNDPAAVSRLAEGAVALACTPVHGYEHDGAPHWVFGGPRGRRTRASRR